MTASTAAKVLLLLMSPLLVPVAAAVLVEPHLYRGSAAEPPSWNAKADRAKIVAEARKLVGVLYDPVQGMYGDAGGRIGLIVCMDVPRLAYRNAGTSLRRLLEADYRKHPEHYGPLDGGPGDPYFDRRARNLYLYCKHNGCLDMKGPPKPGDVVFLSRGEKGWISHIALVSEVSEAGYKVVEASRDDWYLTREHDAKVLFERGWTFRGFGKPLK
ncbi:MAG: DUF1287 domain-containing protein [Elusimicrobiota bacterium]|nr:MAG: DUF1287 domain-containing protein [Elusimicrobiota bacterium]